MAYSNIYLKSDTKIPSVLAVLIIGAAVFATSRFALPGLSRPTRASVAEVKRVEVANINSNSVSIYWSSNSKESGWVLYGTRPDRLSMLAGDDRDLDPSKKNNYRNHYVTLKKLTPNTTYYYQIVSGNKLAAHKDGSAPSLKTAAESRDATGLKPSFGNVTQQDGQPLTNAIVIMTFKDSYPLSTYTKAGGEWLIPLNNIRAKNGRLRIPSETEEMKIEFIGEDQKVSTVIANLKTITPITQAITIGKNYKLTEEGKVLASSVGGKSNGPQIIYPAENSLVPAQSPLIKGTALPNSTVQLRLQGGGVNQTFQEKVDRSGDWKLLLREPLKPGKYTLTLNSSLTRQFSIAKSGESVLAVSTPEATLTPTLAPATPTPTATVITTTVPPPPVTGNQVNTFIATSLSLMIIGLGLMLVF